MMFKNNNNRNAMNNDEHVDHNSNAASSRNLSNVGMNDVESDDDYSRMDLEVTQEFKFLTEDPQDNHELKIVQLLEYIKRTTPDLLIKGIEKVFAKENQDAEIPSNLKNLDDKNKILPHGDQSEDRSTNYQNVNSTLKNNNNHSMILNDFCSYDDDKIVELSNIEGSVTLNLDRKPKKVSVCYIHKNICPILSYKETSEIKETIPILDHISKFLEWIDMLDNSTTKVDVQDMLEFAKFYKRVPNEKNRPKNLCMRNDLLFKSIIDRSLSKEIINFSDNLLYRENRENNCVNRIYSILVFFQIPTKITEVLVMLESIKNYTDKSEYLEKLRTVRDCITIADVKINEKQAVEELITHNILGYELVSTWMALPPHKKTLNDFISIVTMSVNNDPRYNKSKGFKNYNIRNTDNHKNSKKKSKNIKCNYCGYNGHDEKYCRKKKSDKRNKKEDNDSVKENLSDDEEKGKSKNDKQDKDIMDHIGRDKVNNAKRVTPIHKNHLVRFNLNNSKLNIKNKNNKKITNNHINIEEKLANYKKSLLDPKSKTNEDLKSCFKKILEYKEDIEQSSDRLITKEHIMFDTGAQINVFSNRNMFTELDTNISIDLMRASNDTDIQIEGFGYCDLLIGEEIYVFPILYAPSLDVNLLGANDMCDYGLDFMMKGAERTIYVGKEHNLLNKNYQKCMAFKNHANLFYSEKRYDDENDSNLNKNASNRT